MPRQRILVVDDEEHILELIGFNLEKNGFEVITCDNGEKALNLLGDDAFDLVILDLMLPGMDGIEVCKNIRKIESLEKLPIIMLTARSEETDRVLGLELGADDYMVKPFSVRELIARIRAVLRRSEERETATCKILKLNDLTIDTEKHEVKVKGEIIEFTLKEFDLLKILVLNKGKVLSRNYLLDEVWGYDFFGETRTVDVHIRHLRKKIGETDGNAVDYISTIRGRGYKMK
ncbi:MAG: response regulator [Alkaliphilus sp.]